MNLKMKLPKLGRRIRNRKLLRRIASANCGLAKRENAYLCLRNMISFEITFLLFISNRAITRDLPWFVFCSAKETSTYHSFGWMFSPTDASPQLSQAYSLSTKTRNHMVCSHEKRKKYRRWTKRKYRNFAARSICFMWNT